MVIRVYVASSSGSVAVKKHQQAVVGFLEANRINFQEVDITMMEEQRLWMYRHIPRDKQPEKGNPLPPQIFNEEQYCGDYDDFFQSKENNTVFAFLGLSSQPNVKVRFGVLDQTASLNRQGNLNTCFTSCFALPPFW
ncbi:SH3 domain-binding glutamic acid-rich-like protein 2 isoform X2 [Kryptolebias marmoratus]|uniref:SH3 domain-binding glutamic acid-rich-like protein 2 isoform X2 n=1 Tax=Kryptolebias marmoratus TaxID=37003 RepID=UPI0007F8C49E|nr:SH3 domain-binding glutamic acid-rich-like protein 2 isoform X2 [Kryptolebias marmoratus]